MPQIKLPAGHEERFDPISGLIFLQPLIITFILLTSSYPENYTVPTPYWFIILASFIMSIVFYLLHYWLTPQTLLYIIFILDVPLVATVVYFSGGVRGIYPLLYTILIIVSAIYIYRSGAYAISLLSVLFMFGLTLYESKTAVYGVHYLTQRFYLFSLLYLFTAILSGGLSERYRKRTEEFKKLQLTTEEIVKNLPSGIVTIDTSGKILYTNINELELTSRVHLYLAKFLQNPQKMAQTTELKIKKRYYLLSCSLIGNSQGAIAILQDLTEIRRLEETSRISKQTKLLAELSGSLAHEIRNPLSSIRGSLEVMAKSRIPESTTPFLEMALKETARLNEVVTDFLKFAQFVSRKMNRVNINEIITEAILDVSQQFIDRKVEILREGEGFICNADHDRLKSGIVNILANAYEAGTDGKKIYIKINKDKKLGIVEITDEGCGIPKKNLKKVFTPFFTTKKGGTGLGLSIAQKIIEGHKGWIEVSSKVGKGTTFRIILPILTAE